VRVQGGHKPHCRKPECEAVMDMKGWSGPDLETGMTDEEKKCRLDWSAEVAKCPVQEGTQGLLCQCKAINKIVGGKPACKAHFEGNEMCSGMTDEDMKKLECGSDAAFVAEQKKCPDYHGQCACKAGTNLIGRKPECEAVMDMKGCSGPDLETGMTDKKKKKEEEEELELECGTDLVTESMKCPVKEGAQYVMCQCKARTNLVGRKPECEPFHNDACSGMTDEVMKKIECTFGAAFVAETKKCPDKHGLCYCKALTNLIGRKPECEAVMDRKGCSGPQARSGCNAPMFASVALILTVVLTQ